MDAAEGVCDGPRGRVARDRRARRGRGARGARTQQTGATEQCNNTDYWLVPEAVRHPGETHEHGENDPEQQYHHVHGAHLVAHVLTCKQCCQPKILNSKW